MVVLRDMCEQEYPMYCEYFIDDYSRELSKNYGHSKALAIDIAKKDLDRSFPNGLAGNEHSLLCIDAEMGGKIRHVGYLWHSVNVADKSTFIYDFYVSVEYQGLGIGKEAMSVLEKQLHAKGITQIKLRVAYHNERALKLYKEVGFVVTGFNLSKNIG
jgi:ribosomal protein S18 acetylase RimI-like enzyme